MPEMTQAQFKSAVADFEDRIESLTRALDGEAKKNK
jgi:hypothetical protein